MLSFEHLIADHQAVAAKAGTLLRAIGDEAAGEVLAYHVADLDAVLAPHLLIEDRRIYPRLLASADAGERLMATQAIEAYASLAADWQVFVRCWHGSAISAERERFAREVAALLATLQARVKVENELLYPMALRHAHIPLRSGNTLPDQADPPAGMTLQPTGQL